MIVGEYGLREGSENGWKGRRCGWKVRKSRMGGEEEGKKKRRDRNKRVW